jgi:hypothetical protein
MKRTNAEAFAELAPEYSHLYSVANPHVAEAVKLEYKQGYVHVTAQGGFLSKVRLTEFRKMIDTLKERIMQQGEDKVQAYFEVIGGYAPFYICDGDCRKENLKLVEIKNGKVVYEGKTYYYPPFRTQYSDHKTVKDGVAYCYLVMKKIGDYPDTSISNTGKACKKLLELVGENLKFPCFAVRDYVRLEQTIVPKINDLYIHPYESRKQGIQLEYTSSNRNGLDIQIEVTNVAQFVRRYALPKSYGFDKPLVVMTNEFAYSLEVLQDQINDLLRFSRSKYLIEDHEEYGEYTLYHVKLEQSFIHPINEILARHFRDYKGKKFVDSFEEMTKHRNLFE